MGEAGAGAGGLGIGPGAGMGAPGPVSPLWRDAWALAWDKPQGIIVHGDGTGVPTLTDQVAAWLVAAGEGQAQPQALQRLDRDTSGLVLFSLDKASQPVFDALVAGRGMDKRYLALVEGRFPQGERRICQPLGRDRHDSRKMRVSRTGKTSLTVVEPLAWKGGRTLVEVRLETGRRHQIRVHLASLGFPIAGDTLYGRPARGGRQPSLMLHAWQESFTHPVTGERVALRTPWPTRFQELGFPEPDM